MTRDPTQSLSVSPDDDDEPSAELPSLSAELDEPHPSLALGTHDAGTRAESPNARGRTPLPVAAHRPPPPPRDGRPDEPERIGEVLGSYRIVELLGRGGMGYVYRAEHVKLGREVALKLLRSDYAQRRDAVARFFQEARTVNRVRHRNIVDVTDFVELDDGTTFIIMELLRGQSLGRWVRGGLEPARAVAVLVQICDGLAAAHEVGVIHRDLKPDNVIVIPTPDGGDLVKLLDFGVAKLVNRDDEDVGFQTAAGSVIGTPAYMSPEQAGGMPIDARSDIYSLGAIMYELFCGQPMFRGRSFGEYVRRHLTELPVPPRATPHGGHIDPRLEELILRCLEKDPDRRFASIVDLRDALIGLLGAMELPPPLPVPALHGHALSSVSVSSIPPLPGASQRHLPTELVRPPATPWWVWFAIGALAVGLGIGGAVWYASRSAPPAAPPLVIKPDPAAPVPAPAPVQTPAPAPAPAAGAAPAPEPTPEPIEIEPEPVRPPVKTPAPRPRPAKVAPKPEARPEPKPEPRSEPKPKGPIDPTDTLDPFRPKSK